MQEGVGGLAPTECATLLARSPGARGPLQAQAGTGPGVATEAQVRGGRVPLAPGHRVVAEAQAQESGGGMTDAIVRSGSL